MRTEWYFNYTGIISAALCKIYRIVSTAWQKKVLYQTKYFIFSFRALHRKMDTGSRRMYDKAFCRTLPNEMTSSLQKHFFTSYVFFLPAAHD